MVSFVCFRPEQEQPVPVDEELIKMLRVTDSSIVVLLMPEGLLFA
jgi:hypothetical protein